MAAIAGLLGLLPRFRCERVGKTQCDECLPIEVDPLRFAVDSVEQVERKIHVHRWISRVATPLRQARIRTAITNCFLLPSRSDARFPRRVSSKNASVSLRITASTPAPFSASEAPSRRGDP